MYKIKTNGKYVLLIKDLGLTLSYENADGALVDDSDFENSIDVKKVLRYLTVEKLDGDAKIESVSRATAAIEDEKKDTAFVSHVETSVEPEGVFVKNVEIENVPETKIEQPKIIPDVEPKAVESIPEKVESKVEDKIEKTDKVVKETKPQNEDKFSNIEAEVKKINNKKNKNSK